MWRLAEVDDKIPDGAEAVLDISQLITGYQRGQDIQVILVDIPLCSSTQGDIWVGIYMKRWSFTSARYETGLLDSPITAMPLKEGEAVRVGGSLASPINCE